MVAHEVHFKQKSSRNAGRAGQPQAGPGKHRRLAAWPCGTLPGGLTKPKMISTSDVGGAAGSPTPASRGRTGSRPNNAAKERAVCFADALRRRGARGRRLLRGSHTPPSAGDGPSPTRTHGCHAAPSPLRPPPAACRKAASSAFSHAERSPSLSTNRRIVPDAVWQTIGGGGARARAALASIHPSPAAASGSGSVSSPLRRRISPLPKRSPGGDDDTDKTRTTMVGPSGWSDQERPTPSFPRLIRSRTRGAAAAGAGAAAARSPSPRHSRSTPTFAPWRDKARNTSRPVCRW